MKHLKINLLFLSCLLVVCSSEKLKARFDNYRVYTLKIENESQLEILKEAESLVDVYSFWDSATAVGTDVKIQVPPHKLSDFGDLMEQFQFQYSLYIENLQELIDNEQPKMLPKATTFVWTAYQTLSQINTWLDSLVTSYPGIVTKQIAGSSHLGRNLEGVKVSYKSGNKAVFIEGGIHAREWISPATTTYILNQLLTSMDPGVRYIAENYDWYVFPVTNPDGYVHSHESNRMWRKTRNPHSALCVGTDPNRNWAFNWNQGGSSSSACSEIYRGPSAFSEAETRTLSNYYRSLNNVTIYLSMHSFSQVLLVPYGHTRNQLDNHADAVRIGTRSINKLAERYGTRYQIGNIAQLMGIASGGSIDWIKGDQRTPLVYCFELRDTGRHGFLLPVEFIIPTGEETTDAVVELIRAAEENGY